MNIISQGIKQLSSGKFLFNTSEKDLYYLSFEPIDMINIEIILIKLRPNETYVYKTVIPFQKIGTNDISSFDTLKNLNFIIYNNQFSFNDDFNKITLNIDSQSPSQIELFLYNKNMERNNENMKKQLNMKQNLEKLQNRMNELVNIIHFQNKKIFELKQKEEAHIKLINKVDEVTKNISEEYNREYKNKSNNINNNINDNYNNNNYNQNNNFNNHQNNNDMKKNLFISTRPNYNNFPNPNDSNNINMTCKKNHKLSYTVNVELKPILPMNTNIDNLLTRPQNMHPIPQQKPFEKTRSINLDNIQDYRH